MAHLPLTHGWKIKCSFSVKAQKWYNSSILLPVLHYDTAPDMTMTWCRQLALFNWMMSRWVASNQIPSCIIFCTILLLFYFNPTHWWLWLGAKSTYLEVGINKHDWVIKFKKTWLELENYTLSQSPQFNTHKLWLPWRAATISDK